VDVRRSFEEHIALFVAFGNAVGRLTPDAWARISARCADLDQPAFRSLLSRAYLTARSSELFLPGGAESRMPFRLIAGASRAVQRGIAIAGEVAFEFEASAPRVVEPPRRRTKSTGKPHVDAYIDASNEIESALMSLEREHPGVVTAVRSAGQAVFRHDCLSPANFHAVYRYVEPEIPFATLHGMPPDQRVV
jgi:hypothetical protein